MSVNNMYASVEGLQIEILQLQESLVDMEQQYVEKKNNIDASLKSLINQCILTISLNIKNSPQNNQFNAHYFGVTILLANISANYF